MRTLTITSIVLVTIFILVSLVGQLFLEFQTDTVTVTVTDKERVVKGSGDSVTSYYLVFTKDEVFQNRDAIFYGKFESSDLQGKLEKDSTYTLFVTGKRIPFLSIYRNIVKIEK